MSTQTFYLAGESPEKGIQLDTSQASELQALRNTVASHYGIVVPDEIEFQSKTQPLESVEDVRAAKESISITVSGKAVHETPGPEGLPYVGSYLQGDLFSLLRP
jgi:hypothetical protein